MLNVQLHSGKPLILLVEDNPDDELLVRRTFQRAGLKHEIFSVKTGDEGIAYVSGQPPFDNRQKFPIPDLVLLDINIPGQNGFEALRAIRQAWLPWHLPIIMLTSSDQIHDANKAYKLGANSFLVKPLDFANAAELVQSLDKVLAGVHE